MSLPTIAIVGASADRTKFGNKAVRAYLSRGYQVYPVNPRGGVIEGLPAATSLSEVPVERLDRVSVYLPPAVGLAMANELAARPCGELWLNPGSADPALVDKLKQLGVEPVLGCSIVDIGVDPSDLDE